MLNNCTRSLYISGKTNQLDRKASHIIILVPQVLWTEVHERHYVSTKKILGIKDQHKHLPWSRSIVYLCSVIGYSRNCQKKTTYYNKCRIITCPLILCFWGENKYDKEALNTLFNIHQITSFLGGNSNQKLLNPFVMHSTIIGSRMQGQSKVYLHL